MSASFSSASIYSTEHVLPRSLEELDEYAHAKSRQTLAETLVKAFKMSSADALVIANAVVDPSAVRKDIGDPNDPNFERIPIPGGELMGIRTRVWSPWVMPNPANPRNGPARRHPIAVDPGTGSEANRFRPVTEPTSPAGRGDSTELSIDVDSREHLAWAAAEAAKYVLAQNDWRSSIASQGVMEAVWVVPITFSHRDGSASVTAMVTIEGSSRTTAVHDIMKVASADVPYGTPDAKFRTEIRRLNEARHTGLAEGQSEALRCMRIPALILVGFRRQENVTVGFDAALRSLVALRHVDPPKPWGDGPENESLADEVLAELHRQGLIGDGERAYLAGSCTRAEARAAHLPDDPASRAARIIHVFANPDARFKVAVRSAVTRQSTRKYIGEKLKNDLATALILRASAADADKVDRARRYLRHAFGKAVHRNAWEATGRDHNALVTEAVREVSVAIGSGSTDDPGPASLELAVRAAYSLIVSGQLTADRGTANNDQPDRRTPAEVLDRMRQTVQGVLQLGQALDDHAAGRPIRAVDASGTLISLSDGSGDLPVNDVYLRNEFPPPGKVRPSARPGDTPTAVLRARVAELSAAVEALGRAHAAVAAVEGADGLSLAEADGVDPRDCGQWRTILQQIDDDLNAWGRRFTKRHGIKPPPSPRNGDVGDTFDPDVDPTPEGQFDETDGWDAAAEKHQAITT